MVGSPGGRLVYYTTPVDVRVYNRATRSNTAILNGRYGEYVVVSNDGDRLALLRSADASSAAPDQRLHVWTVAVNPLTGAATGEPRRVSMVSGEAPRFSPDGRQIAFIATGNPRRMIVMPVSGGVERVLFEGGEPEAPVRWSPDGKWIYFSQPSHDPAAPFIVSRVSVAGGTPTQMTPPVVSPVPGLTLDGRHIIAMTGTGGSADLYSIFDLEKKLLGRTRVAFDPQSDRGAFAWSGDGMKALFGSTTAGRSLQTFSISTGETRTIPTDHSFNASRSTSPDGKLVATISAGKDTPWELGVMNSDGTGKRSLGSLNNSFPTEVLYWSPNSRYLAYAGDANKSLYVTDVTAGMTRKVATAALHLVGVRWAADSRSLKYGTTEGTPTRARAFVREFTLDGHDRLLSDVTSFIPTEGQPWYAVKWFLGDSALLFFREGLVVPLRGGDSRRIYEPRPMNEVGSVAVVSTNGRWILLPADDGRSVQLISSDGQVRNSVSMPGGARIERTPFIQSHPEGFITVTTGPEQVKAIQFVPFDGSQVKTLVAGITGTLISDVQLSSDGRTLYYIRTGSLTAHVQDVDLGAGLGAVRR